MKKTASRREKNVYIFWVGQRDNFVLFKEFSLGGNEGRKPSTGSTRSTLATAQLNDFTHVSMLTRHKTTSWKHRPNSLLFSKSAADQSNATLAGSGGLIGNQKSISIGNAISTVAWRFL